MFPTVPTKQFVPLAYCKTVTSSIAAVNCPFATPSTISSRFLKLVTRTPNGAVLKIYFSASLPNLTTTVSGAFKDVNPVIEVALVKLVVKNAVKLP